MVIKLHFFFLSGTVRQIQQQKQTLKKIKILTKQYYIQVSNFKKSLILSRKRKMSNKVFNVKSVEAEVIDISTPRGHRCQLFD